MKLLVTGGAGFIGANYIEYHLASHPADEIVCLDVLTYAGKRERLAQAERDPRFQFVLGDICDREAVDRLFAEQAFDAVIHFAAESHVDRSLQDPALFLRVNLLGTQVLLDACVRHGVRFHQISTDEVYGDLPLDEPAVPFTEESPLRPSSPYSASKAAADLLVLSYVRSFGLRATVTRCGNNYGKFQLEEKLIPRMIECAKHDRPLPVYGTGANIRDWVAVEDHCRAVDLVLHEGVIGEVYNVGAGFEIDNLTLIKRILRQMGKPETLISFVGDRPGHDRRYALNAAKLRALGWEPRVPFDEGLSKTVEWYLKR